MKVLDSFISRIGIDKVLHFTTGGMISALIGASLIVWEDINNFSIYGTALIGTLSVLVIAVIKELCLDDSFDKKDILASVLGTLPMYLAISIGLLLHFISS